MNIPFLDIKKVNKPYEKEFIKCMEKIISKGIYISGDEVIKFEKSFAEFIGTDYCIACANGLNALELILTSYEFKKGDEIIVPANTYYATVLAIINCGLLPILVEPEILTYNINPDLIEEKITDKTKAILVVHLYGLVTDMQKIYQLSDKYKLKIIEDAAQAHGAIYQNIKAGNLGNAAAFSFYPTKNLGALGDAGAITTNDLIIYEKIKKKINYGFSKQYVAEVVGTNSRMDELQAAILSYKLKYLTEANNFRKKVAFYYNKNISNNYLETHLTEFNQNHVWHLYVIRTQFRELFIEYMNKNGIEVSIHYPIPVHKQKSLPLLNHLNFPVTEKIHQEIVSIPLNTSLSWVDVEYITNTISAFNIK